MVRVETSKALSRASDRVHIYICPRESFSIDEASVQARDALRLEGVGGLVGRFYILLFWVEESQTYLEIF